MIKLSKIIQPQIRKKQVLVDFLFPYFFLQFYPHTSDITIPKW
jgi:hypothetical protein